MKDDPNFLAWAAGFFDGEGCVLVELANTASGPRTSLHVSVTQTSTPCLHRFLVFGGGVSSAKRRTPQSLRMSVQFMWQVRDRAALDFLAAVLPYLVVKKEQAEVALTYPLPAPTEKRYGNGNRIPEEIKEARLAIRTRLKEIRASMKTPALEIDRG